MSGWSIWDHGQLVSSGEVGIDDWITLTRICERAMERGETCVLVLERPFGGSNSGTLMALGAAHHAWRKAWKLTGGSSRKIVRVDVSTWRSQVLGMTRGPGLQQRERETALSFKGGSDVGPDEAAAICIGRYATHAGEIGAVLSARIRKAVCA
jgi:hypothetical protein